MKIVFHTSDFTLSQISTHGVSNDTPSISRNFLFVAAESFFQTEKHSCGGREYFSELLKFRLPLTEHSAESPELFIGQSEYVQICAVNRQSNTRLDRRRLDGVDMRSDLVTGQPEVCRCRIIYLINDEVVGIYSNETALTARESFVISEIVTANLLIFLFK